jgi:hypothetical protein
MVTVVHVLAGCAIAAHVFGAYGAAAGARNVSRFALETLAAGATFALVCIAVCLAITLALAARIKAGGNGNQRS